MYLIYTSEGQLYTLVVILCMKPTRMACIHWSPRVALRKFSFFLNLLIWELGTKETQPRPWNPYFLEGYPSKRVTQSTENKGTES